MQQSSGFIILDRSSAEPKVLVVRAYSNWGFPKGHIEPGETRFDAAVRETKEETCLVQGVDFDYTGQQAPSITYGKGSRMKTVYHFIGQRTSEKDPYLPVNPELGKPENDEWAWISMSKLPQLLAPRFAPINLFLQTL